MTVVFGILGWRKLNSRMGMGMETNDSRSTYSVRGIPILIPIPRENENALILQNSIPTFLSIQVPFRI